VTLTDIIQLSSRRSASCSSCYRAIMYAAAVGDACRCNGVFLAHAHRAARLLVLRALLLRIIIGQSLAARVYARSLKVARNGASRSASIAVLRLAGAIIGTRPVFLPPLATGFGIRADRRGVLPVGLRAGAGGRTRPSCHRQRVLLAASRAARDVYLPLRGALNAGSSRRSRCHIVPGS